MENDAFNDFQPMTLNTLQTPEGSFPGVPEEYFTAMPIETTSVYNTLTQTQQQQQDQHTKILMSILQEMRNDNTNMMKMEMLLQKKFRSGPSEEETIEEGKALFGRFIVDEIDREEGLVTPEEIKVELDQLCTPQGYANPAWAKAGRDLRRYADEFMRSKERGKVRRRAAEMTENSSDVTEDQFKDLLSELLGSGITRERIIVLFYFCADVAIETLKRRVQSSVQLCQRFIQWSFNFISERVCTWVQANGGWGAVFNSTVVIFGRAVMFFGFGMICYYAYKKFIKAD